MVTDAISGMMIDGAWITTDFGYSAVSVGGRYSLPHTAVQGNVWMDVEAEGYQDTSVSVYTAIGDESVEQDITMSPLIITRECERDEDCNDGVFCNGKEVCDRGRCYEGAPPCQDDGLFCNGQESCNEETNRCESSGNPCPGNLTCDEEGDRCTGCLHDSDCNDELFCNGMETCVDGVCREGVPPCHEGFICIEETDECIKDPDVPKIELYPDFCYQSRWIPIPMFMRIEGKNTHFKASTRVTFTPTGSIFALPLVGGEENIFLIGIVMPQWFLQEDAVILKIVTGSEVVSGTVNLVLPFSGEDEDEDEDVR